MILNYIFLNRFVITRKGKIDSPLYFYHYLIYLFHYAKDKGLQRFFEFFFAEVLSNLFFWKRNFCMNIVLVMQRYNL